MLYENGFYGMEHVISDVFRQMWKMKTVKTFIINMYGFNELFVQNIEIPPNTNNF